MQQKNGLKLFFIVNENSGNNDTDWHNTIEKHFAATPHSIVLYDMPEDCCADDIVKEINTAQPDRVIAVGGDGTVKLAAECCMQNKIVLGIVPGGSANGMAKELQIPTDISKALDIVTTDRIKSVHLTQVNEDLCIHLCDIGFNAYVIKKFDTLNSRGMWGYVKAAWHVLRSHSRMQVNLNIDGKETCKEAAMVVIANATQYGSGALINPKGNLEDELFEIVIIKKVSFSEIFKMIVTHQPYDPDKTELYQTHSLHITSEKPAHFQIDGEYLGKTKELKATIMPQALQIVVPAE